MMSLSEDIIAAFNTTSRYLDVFLKINNIYFDNIIQIYPLELQLNQADTSRFLDLHLSISNNIISSKIYDKRNDFRY